MKQYVHLLIKGLSVLNFELIDGHDILLNLEMSNVQNTICICENANFLCTMDSNGVSRDLFLK